MKLALTVLKHPYAICMLKAGSALPSAFPKSEFYSVTNTTDELSIVCRYESVSDDWTTVNRNWRIFKIKGPLQFTLVGIIAKISAILKEQDIPIFTTSTFLTDYIMVKEENLEKAVKSLRAKGCSVTFQ